MCFYFFVFEFQSFSKAYSKAHITTSANKNTQVTPTVVNIVLHLHMPFTIIFLSPLQVTISIFILNILYHSFVFCIQYSCENFLLFLQILCFWIWLLYTLKRGQKKVIITISLDESLRFQLMQIPPVISLRIDDIPLDRGNEALYYFFRKYTQNIQQTSGNKPKVSRLPYYGCLRGQK